MAPFHTRLHWQHAGISLLMLSLRKERALYRPCCAAPAVRIACRVSSGRGTSLPHTSPWPCRHRATRLCIEAVQSLMKACDGDLQFEGPGWNSCTVDLIRLAKAHSVLVLHQTFMDSVANLQGQVSPVATG